MVARRAGSAKTQEAPQTLSRSDRLISRCAEWQPNYVRRLMMNLPGVPTGAVRPAQHVCLPPDGDPGATPLGFVRRPVLQVG